MINIVCVIPSACTNKTLPYIKRCINSLKTAAAGHVNLTILVISSNNEAKKLLLQSPIDNFYLVDSSLGFAQMNNIAIEESLLFYKADYYFFVNDDAWVEKNFFLEFKRVIRQSPADVISPLVYRAKTKVIDSFGIEYFKSGYAKNSTSMKTRTALATAACVVIKTSFLKKMKRAYGFYFNPILYYYLEDVELSVRAAALGATFMKSHSLIAHHIGSATSGKQSYFTMYQTYRNIIWVILLTWPFSAILRNLGSILLVLGWTMIYSLRTFGPKLYLSLLKDTLIHIKPLITQRKRILKAYLPSFRFTDILSPYAFRTYHGITI